MVLTVFYLCSHNTIVYKDIRDQWGPDLLLLFTTIDTVNSTEVIALQIDISLSRRVFCREGHAVKYQKAVSVVETESEKGIMGQSTHQLCWY